MSQASASPPKVVVLGGESEFSAVVIDGLVEAGINVVAFVSHDPYPPDTPGRSLRVVVGGSGPATAVEHNVPVIPIRSVRDSNVYETLSIIEPDVMLAACFPFILPPEWLQLAGQMCLNLHPSLLPSYRGPTPLFWQFREGEVETGVTLHLMESEPDAGDIVGQSALVLEAGTSFSKTNVELASMGVDLVVYVLERLEAGMWVLRTPQDDVMASYQPFPKEKDFRFDTHFSAERAYRFIEGTREWQTPFEIDVGDDVLTVERALKFYDDPHMALPFEAHGERLRIRFSDGTLEAIGHPVS